MVAAFHDITRIVSLFSTTVDALWQDDGIEYKSVVIAVEDDVVTSLQQAVDFIAASSDNVLVVDASGNLHAAAAICALHLMNQAEPRSAIASEAWLKAQRSTITIQDDETLWKAVEMYEGVLGTKRPVPPDSPQSPGKKVRQEVMEHIDELSLGSPKAQA